MISLRAASVWALLLLACSSSGPYVWVSQVPVPPPTTSEALDVGDRVQVVVADQPTMSGEFDVRPGGEIVLPVSGTVRVAGMAPAQLAAHVTARLRGVLADPRVSVVVVARSIRTVSVLGEVAAPGRYELRGNQGVLEALAYAHGLTPFADRDRVFVLRRTGAHPRVRLSYDELVRGDPSSIGFRLGDGDVVVVE